MNVLGSPMEADSSIGAIDLATPGFDRLRSELFSRESNAGQALQPDPLGHNLDDSTANLSSALATPYRLAISNLGSVHTARKVRHRPVDGNVDVATVNREPMHVFCRIRPLQAGEGTASCLEPIQEDNDDKPVATGNPGDGTITRSLWARAPKNSFVFRQGGNAAAGAQFTFSGVFPPETPQANIFFTSARPLVASFLSGTNGLLFAYGVTNAGKTFTMNGTPKNPGLLPRILDCVFNSVGGNLAARKRQHARPQHEAGPKAPKYKHTSEKLPVATGKKFLVTVSSLEIYNEHIYDLLVDIPANPDQRECLHLKEGVHGSIFVQKLTEEVVHSASEAHEILHRGIRNRTVAGTQMNCDSSRSHSVIQIKLMQLPAGLDAAALKRNKEVITTSVLSLIDLAGSERNKRTGTTGSRQREASAINSSLMTLGRCIAILKQNQEALRAREAALSRSQGLGAEIPPARLHVVPFRNSKLTRLFQDYFTGNGQAAMIANASPAEQDFDETFQALRFAALAQQVSTGQERHRLGQQQQSAIRISTSTLVAGDKDLHAREQELLRREQELEELEETLRLEFDEAIALAQDDIEERVRSEVAHEFGERLEDMQRRLNSFTIQQSQIQQDRFERRLEILRTRSDAEQEQASAENEELRDMLDSFQEQFEELRKASEAEKIMLREAADKLAVDLTSQEEENAELLRQIEELRRPRAETELLREKVGELEHELGLLRQEKDSLRDQVVSLERIRDEAEAHVCPVAPTRTAHMPAALDGEDEEILGVSPVAQASKFSKASRKVAKKQKRQDKKFEKGLKAISKLQKKTTNVSMDDQEQQENSCERTANAPVSALASSIPVRPRKHREVNLATRKASESRRTALHPVSSRLRTHEQSPLDETFSTFMG